MSSRSFKNTGQDKRRPVFSHKMHIKKGDKVIVIAGKDKGVTGTVLVADPVRQKVLVEGVNRVTKHTRVSTTQRGSKSGGITTQEAPVHVSNVMLTVEVDGQTVGTRVGYRFNDQGTKVRVARRTDEEI